MRSRASVCLSLALACGGDDGGRGDSGNATAVTTASNSLTMQPTTSGESASELTSTLTEALTSAGQDATSADPDSSPPDGTSTGLITTFFTTGDTFDSFDSFDTLDSEGPECDQTFKATIRDFREDHPDFEDYTGDSAFKGIVLPDLGPDQNPVYAAAGGTAQTTGPAEFSQWYNDVANVNIPFLIELQLTEVGPGLFSYQNNAFYPIDGQGWDNEGNPHNYHFTTEIHLTFAYNGGEKFTFTGDDDLWLFINEKLAIDLGGTHPELSDTVDLDAQAATLGIVPGNTYAMDIFHAERHTDQSNFRVDTSIKCFFVPG